MNLESREHEFLINILGARNSEIKGNFANIFGEIFFILNEFLKQKISLTPQKTTKNKTKQKKKKH